MPGQDDICFGEFVLDRSRGCLRDASGTERELRPKAFAALEALARTPDQIVSKDALASQIWPDMAVTDDSIAQCIRAIRRALGDQGAAHIRTLPRRGYMLVTAPEGVQARQPGEDPPPSADLQPKKRGRTLVGAAGAASLAAAALGLALMLHSPANPPSELPDELVEARNLLDASDWQRRADNDSARALIESVLLRDQENAAAWTALGSTYWNEVRHLAWGGGRREMQQAMDAVERALTHGPDAETHRLLAEMRLAAPFAEVRSPVDALAAARAAVALAPEDVDTQAMLAYALALNGRPHEAFRLIASARRSPGTDANSYAQIAGLAALLAGRPDTAAEEFAHLLETADYSSGRLWPGWLLAASLAHAGRIDEAVMVVEQGRTYQPNATLDAVAGTLDAFAQPRDRALVIDGLRRAGLSG